MEGRETGTRGHVHATDYIAAQVKALGLMPMGDNGTYFQNVPVIRRSLDPASTISAPGRHAPRRARTSSPRGAGQRPLRLGDAPIVYGGMPGDTTRRADARIRCRGRSSRTARRQGRVADAVGSRAVVAAGAVVATAPGRRWRARRRQITVVDQLSEAQVRAAMHPREGDVQLKADASDSATAPTDHHHARRGRAAPRRFARRNGRRGRRARRCSFNVKFVDSAGAGAQRRRRVHPGSDRQAQERVGRDGRAQRSHRDSRQGAPIDHDSLHLYAQAAYPIREHIALYNLENHICGGRQQTECYAATPAQQAHLDSLNAQIAAIHINLDSVRKVNGGVRLDSISNGADDDGSGTVTLLEIAETFAKAKPKTKRSMLFVWHVGEEKGLWGSQYITDHPPVPRDSIVAQLNMDMVGRGAASDLFEGGPTYVQLVGVAPAVDGARRHRRDAEQEARAAVHVRLPVRRATAIPRTSTAAATTSTMRVTAFRSCS